MIKLWLHDLGTVFNIQSTYNINRVQKLQKRAERIILQADFMTPPKEIFRELGWLTFTNRVEYHICIMVFKSLNGQAPEYLSSFLTKSSERKRARARACVCVCVCVLNNSDAIFL